MTGKVLLASASTDDAELKRIPREQCANIVSAVLWAMVRDLLESSTSTPTDMSDRLQTRKQPAWHRARLPNDRM